MAGGHNSRDQGVHMKRLIRWLLILGIPVLLLWAASIPVVQYMKERRRVNYREVEVTRLVEQGLRNRDIARSLGIQTGTVKIHLKHIFEKTGVRGRYGLR